ncbi:MAG: membrane protein insertase YidC [Bryobacteraceae bacterium]|jgi:YidC/Oxa1 family membrane protein insertase
MAESANGSGNPRQPPKEMSMEVRLLLAFLLMGAVMFLTPYLFKTAAPPPPVKKAEQAAPAQPQPAPENIPAAPVAEQAKAERPAKKVSSKAVPSAPATPQRTEPAFVINTNLFTVALSNQGATVRSWLLKKYHGNDGKLLDLVNSAAGLEFPFSLYFPDKQPGAKVNWTYYTQTGDPDGLGVTYAFSDGHTSVRKVFRFQKDSYLLQVSTEVTADGHPVPHMIQWRGGFGDFTVTSAVANQHTLYFDVAQNKLVEQRASAAKNGPVTASGNFSFGGLADTFFAAVFLPDGKTAMQQVTFSDTVRTAFDEKPEPFAGAAVSDGAANRFDLFVGPKDVDLLKRVNPKLEQVVDFGWLAFLAKPLFLIVNWFNNAFVHNFGWSIVVVTIVINFVLFPLRLSNMKSMKKMQALKPQIEAINARYKNIGIRDPKKAEQNQEVMALYKKYGVNPMGGCFPMLIQIPFFIAFYKVFTVSVEMRGANWLWVTDLSQHEYLPIHILPIIMIVSQFVMQKMTPQAAGDPNQQRMMMLMPLIFGFMFYNLPSGLVLYYLTSNLVSVGQQWFFNHTALADAAAQSVALPKKKNGRK